MRKDSKQFLFKSVPPDSLLFQSTLKSPHCSEKKTELHALSLTHTHTHTHTPSFLYQHCLYLLYRSVRGAVRENTRGRGERQSILQERKSTGVDGAPVCAFMCVSVSLMAVTLSLKNTDHLFQGFQCLWLSHT